jgi:hypothetical protein
MHCCFVTSCLRLVEAQGNSQHRHCLFMVHVQPSPGYGQGLCLQPLQPWRTATPLCEQIRPNSSIEA